ncbi:hypothetical protein EH228_06925 [Erwinia endophytica]|uniref:hypothetical protein n=1 Tax=Erwinia endophytica TaxID=1563158 RepID=UPI001265E5FF|nr:hypothetical protein [Erwinia endophytica]KAB8312519.1 hypothetical protein EH228_06925 [Erwinia endophytica]
MIPSYTHFSRRHTLIFAAGCFITTAILTSSLLRNTLVITPLRLFIGLAAIGGSIAWNTAREGRGYWIYTIATLRMYENEVTLNEKSALPENKFNRYLSMPWCSLLVTLALALLLSITGAWLPPLALRYWAFLCGVLILPFSLCYIYNHASQATIRQTILHISGIKRIKVKQRSLAHYLAEDLFIMLLVNLALVLPIAKKAAFSLAHGSHTPTFIIAMIILMEIVMGFILLIAFRTRRFIFCGELILDAVKIPTRLSERRLKYRLFFRIIGWLLVTLFWTVFICLFFSSHAPHFTLVYLSALSVPLLIFILERYNTLTVHYHQANRILSELKKLAPEDKKTPW